MRHDSLSAEKLSLAWHIFGAFVSMWWAVASVASCLNSEPFAALNGAVGFVFYHQYMASGAHAFVAAAGCIWHVWAGSQHRKQIETLQQRNRMTTLEPR